jgi:hypothetical protein
MRPDCTACGTFSEISNAFEAANIISRIFIKKTAAFSAAVFIEMQNTNAVCRYPDREV